MQSSIQFPLFSRIFFLFDFQSSEQLKRVHSLFGSLFNIAFSVFDKHITILSGTPLNISVYVDGCIKFFMLRYSNDEQPKNI